MNKKLSLLVGLLALIITFGFKADKPLLAFGAKAPMADREMTGIKGKAHSLNSLKGEKGLLVVFSCNTCPFVLGWEDQYNGLKEIADAQGIGMVLVNSNEKKRKGDDSMEAMQAHAKDQAYSMPYVIDTNNELADAFGARTTPHVFLFNGDLELVYRGSINDKYENRSKEAEDMYLSKALKSLGAGKDINPNDTRELGCSIKRV